ncbi:VanZ family protein [Brumimicrobium aurantiacum]|uniref:VanZ family protein n=2 Tax=Brumimicrobium aurantiacum TaxID=1737063 RepID=A0A3E1EXA1_9FLAO|nr:VanZ family protein [Brumimicrobium aurantiacum]
MYSLMSLFWVIGLKRQNIYIGVRRRAFHITVIGTMLLSFAIELIQEEFLPTRGFEVLDLIANGIGCIFGILIFKIIYYNSYK